MSSSQTTRPFDAYAPPAAEAEPGSDGDGLDDLVDKTRPTSLVITTAGVVALTGTIMVLAALQLWMYFTDLGVVRIIPWAMLVLGATHVAIATKIFRLRLWAAQVGFGLGIASTLGAAAWLLFSTASGVFTLYGLMLPVGGAAAAVLSFLALAPARAATLARRKLATDGVQTDF